MPSTPLTSTTSVPAQVAAAQPLARPGRRARLSGPATAVATLAVLAGTGFADGGYFPESWGWTALACAWAAAVVLVGHRSVAVPRRGGAAVGLLAAFAVWVALSAVWSEDPTQSALDAERVTVYVAVLLAALVVGRASVEWLLGGVWLATVALAGYGLLTRLLPERVGVFDPVAGYRLSEPIGYWNAVGLLAALGAMLAVALAAHAAHAAVRVATAASVPLLVAALYFTFSRGAWVALAVGLLLAAALDPRRARVAVVLGAVGPWTALGVAAAARFDSLTVPGASLAAMTRDGHRVAAVLAVLGILAGVSTALAARVEPRFGLSPRGRRRLATAGAVAIAVVLAVGAVRAGSPAGVVSRAWDQFATRDPANGSDDLNARLLSVSGSGRVDWWRVAANDVRAHPWLGSGAGTFERRWNRERPRADKVRDAHSLYLETLAELGPVGLLLLLAALLLPLTAARAARRSPLGPVAVGAYAAALLHAGVDWDWELTAVTAVALACGAAVVLAGDRAGAPLGRRGRGVATAAAVLVAAAAVFTIATRQPIAKLREAIVRADWPAAQRQADRASSLAPWSSEPYQVLGDGLLAGGRFAAARAALRVAVEKDGGDWALWLSLARASDGRERATALDRAEALNPRSPEVAAFRALLQSVSGLGPAG